jgi:TRAP-type uncharacterized transport system substrate-binding protein
LGEVLRSAAAQHGLQLRLTPSGGARQDLDDVAAGKVDLALISGDLRDDVSGVRQVANLTSEALHLFVKQELIDLGITSLKGKRIATGGPESGTSHLALKVLEFVGLQPGRDFENVAATPTEWWSRIETDQPDAIFMLSPLPFRSGDELISQYGYQLMPLPYADAMALLDREIHDFVIPSFSYSVSPPGPAAPLHTVATPMILVANSEVSSAAVERLAEVLFDGDFARMANLPPFDPQRVLRMHDFRVHPGMQLYLRRGQPVVNGEFMSKMEDMRSFLVSAAVSLFLFLRWYQGRRLSKFEDYYDAVTEVERQAIARQESGELTLPLWEQLGRQLYRAKADVLDKHASGALEGGAELQCFLAHVNDVRACLVALRPDGPTRSAMQAADALEQTAASSD